VLSKVILLVVRYVKGDHLSSCHCGDKGKELIDLETHCALGQ